MQDVEGLFCFVFMWDLVSVSIRKSDTLPPFSCSSIPVYSFPSQQQIRSLLQKTIWFLSSLALTLCFVLIRLFFFNLNFQKSICFCSWCQKTTLWRIFLGHSVEHSTDFAKCKERQPNTCIVSSGHPLPMAVLFKNRLTWPYDAMAYSWVTAFVGIHYPASFGWQNWWYPPRGIKWFIRENILTSPYHKGLHEGCCFINDGYLMQNTSLWC